MHIISVVDDDVSVRSATVDLLNSVGLASEAFPSAEAYLSSGVVANTSCLILDVRMPGMNGLELQKRLLDDGHSIPVIFITSFPEERMRLRAVHAGAICYLSKPYRDDELLDCIYRTLGTQV